MADVQGTKQGRAVAITPSDSMLLPFPTSTIAFTATAGQTLKVDTTGGDVGVSLTFGAGEHVVPLQATRVYANGTNVTNISGYG